MAMPPPAEAEAEEDDAVSATLHPREEIRENRDGNASCRCGIRDLPLQEHPQRPDCFKVPPWLDLDKLIRQRTRFRWLNIDCHDGAVVPAIRQKLPLRLDRVTLEMPRMRDGWVGAPEEDQVGPGLGCAERSGRFANFLQRHHRGAMAERRGGIDRRPQCIRQAHRRALPSRAASGQAVN